MALRGARFVRGAAALGILIFGNAALGQAETGLRVTSHGAWTVERVGPQGDAACTALLEQAGGVAAIISQSSGSPFVLPVFEMETRVDFADPEKSILLKTGTYQAVLSFERSFDEESAYLAAVPREEDAQAVISAMRKGGEMRITYGGDILAVLPLSGFDAAWGEVLGTCD